MDISAFERMKWGEQLTIIDSGSRHTMKNSFIIDFAVLPPSIVTGIGLKLYKARHYIRLQHQQSRVAPNLA